MNFVFLSIPPPVYYSSQYYFYFEIYFHYSKYFRTVWLYILYHSEVKIHPVITSIPVSVATVHDPPETSLNLLPSVTISSLTFNWIYWIRRFVLLLSEKLDNSIFFHAGRFAIWFLKVLKNFEFFPFKKIVFNNSTLFCWGVLIGIVFLHIVEHYSLESVFTVKQLALPGSKKYLVILPCKWLNNSSEDGD